MSCKQCLEFDKRLGELETKYFELLREHNKLLNLANEINDRNKEIEIENQISITGSALDYLSRKKGAFNLIVDKVKKDG